MQTSIPKDIREHIARAKGYLRRDELPRALESISIALKQSVDIVVTRAVRSELKIHFEEFLQELVRNAGMQPLLDPQNTGKPRAIPYQAGKEAILSTVLENLGKMLIEVANQQQQQALANEEQRKQELLTTGTLCLSTGEVGRGRAFLKRVAAEFGHQPGVLFDIGQRLLTAGQHMDAFEVFESVMEQTPKMVEAYSAAIDACTEAREFEKAEATYTKVLRQFGGHPRTFGKMAQMYLQWGKRPKAEELAVRALQGDPEQAEALAAMAAIGRTYP